MTGRDSLYDWDRRWQAKAKKERVEGVPAVTPPTTPPPTPRTDTGQRLLEHMTEDAAGFISLTSGRFSIAWVLDALRKDIPAIETEAAGAALAALRAQVEAPELAAIRERDAEDERWRGALEDSFGPQPDHPDFGEGHDDYDCASRDRRTLLHIIDGLSGAAPAAGEVARIGFPGQPFGYATGGNEPAPAAPAAPDIDVERLADVLTLRHVQTAGMCSESHLDEATAIAAAYARLANPEKP